MSDISIIFEEVILQIIREISNFTWIEPRTNNSWTEITCKCKSNLIFYPSYRNNTRQASYDHVRIITYDDEKQYKNMNPKNDYEININSSNFIEQIKECLIKCECKDDK